MPRSEAQKAADKRYRETHKKNNVVWGTRLNPSDAEAIDNLLKEKGMNKAEFIRWAAEQLKNANLQ
jgi:hypothetical protein